MFGRKQAEIDRLREANANLNQRLEHWERAEAKREAALTKLTRDLREMDQLVYQMSQAMDAATLRSAVSRAWSITEARMQAESQRLKSMLIPEIIKTYTDPKQVKLVRKSKQ